MTKQLSTIYVTNNYFYSNSERCTTFDIAFDKTSPILCEKNHIYSNRIKHIWIVILYAIRNDKIQNFKDKFKSMSNSLGIGFFVTQ